MPQQSLPPSTSAASDQASEPVVAAPLNEDPESVKKVQEDLEGAGATPVVREEEGIILKDYGRVDGGPRIVTSEPAPPKPGEVSPFFRVGAGWGIYVYLTPDEQLLVAAGAAGGLTPVIHGDLRIAGC